METTKYFRTYHFPFSKSVTSDDKITKDYSFLENREVVILEKLDGQNNSICKGGVYARSHSAYSNKPWDREVWNIHARINHQLDEETYIFGENLYAIHSLEYRKLESYFFVFGVRVGNEWLSWSDVILYADMLELPTVPTLALGTYSDIKTEVEQQVGKLSAFDGYDPKDGREQMEGVVVRITDSFTQEQSKESVCKYVRANHVQTSDKNWHKEWRAHKLIR